MRDYLSPAKRVMARAIPRPATVRVFVARHRAFVFMIVASFVVITTLGYISARALTGDSESSSNALAEPELRAAEVPSFDGASKSEGTVTDDANVEGDRSTESANTPPDSESTNTTVTVNDQKIEVPKNGTTHKTIVSDDGTTTVRITSNSSSDNDSSTSTSLNVNTSTSSVSKGSTMTEFDSW